MSADQKCSTCAYRVYEVRRQLDPYQAGSTMVCLHRRVGRSDCKQVRTVGPCGEDAALWAPREKEAQS